MSKPLSDQSFTDIYLNILNELSLLRGTQGELETERDDLEAENAALRRERDDARAQGITDLNTIHRHQATIRRLEEERDQLRAGQGTWPDDKTDDFPCCSGGQVPRVIRAEELREGQVAAIHDEELNSVVGGLVSRVENGGGIMRFKGHGETIFGLDRSEVDTIVLLENAPYYTDQINANTIHSHHLAPEPTPAPRLTVHALNTAPVGSVVTDEYGNQYTKTEDGDWDSFTGYHINSDIVQWADATLTHPERGGHE